MLHYSNGQFTRLEKQDGHKILYPRRPFFAANMPTPPGSALSVDPQGRRAKASVPMIRYRALAYYELSHPSIRDEQVIQRVRKSRSTIGILIHYLLPLNAKYSRKKVFMLLRETIKRICSFLDLNNLPIEVQIKAVPRSIRVRYPTKSVMIIDLFDGAVK